MFVYLKILLLLLLHPALSRPLNSLTRQCPTCKGKSSLGQTTEGPNVTTLAPGEPCGVYTLRCAHGLKCTPPEKDPRDLSALQNGRGVCSNISRPVPSQSTGVTMSIPDHTDTTPTEDPDEAPCRKLLTALIKALGTRVFTSHDDVYIPNCDMDGFFKKKQCWSSRGRQRGRCWCVDGNGRPVPSHTTQEGTVMC